MEKITASETIDKGLISKNTQVAHATQYQKNNQPRQKVGKRPKQTTFPKKTYRQLTSTWKDAQHHLLLEKCKSKLQWDIILLQSECPSLKSLQTINAGEGVENKEPSCIVGGNRNWYTHYGRQYEDSLKKKKLGIKPRYDPAIPLLGIYPKETRTEKDTCTAVFIAAWFTVARTWKQPRCPSTDEWIKKLQYIYTMEYYSTTKGTYLSQF